MGRRKMMAKKLLFILVALAKIRVLTNHFRFNLRFGKR